MKWRNATRKVEFGQPKNDNLPITKCVCGTTFQPWGFVITTHKETPAMCPSCKRRLFWNANIRVYEA